MRIESVFPLILNLGIRKSKWLYSRPGRFSFKERNN
jgi:hypothetical protein